MNKYKKLVNNSVIFAIGNFGSKLMSFVMVPVYSYTLTTNEFGKVDLLTSVVSLIMPIICMNIYDSVFRFALDKYEDKKKVFSTGLFFLSLTSVLALIIGLILSRYINNYPILYTTIYMIATMFNSLILNFVRALGYVKQFAIAGIVSTFVMGISNILLLVVFHLGMNGYMMSMIFAQLISLAYLIFATKVATYISPKKYDKNSLREMMVYGIPLIPNSLAWWLNSTSDRIFIVWILGATANGIYAMANKLPSIITTISTIFFQSWQMSVVEEYDNKDSKKFISSVFESYISCLFFLGIGAVAIIRPVYRIILSSNYFIGWKITPALILAVIYTSIASFLGTIYTASKKTVSVLVTTIYGAIANVILTLILLKIIGINGAALANAISFFIVSAIRYKEIKAADKIELNMFKFLSLHILFAVISCILLLVDNDIVVFIVGLTILIVQSLFDSNIKRMLILLIKKKKVNKNE